MTNLAIPVPDPIEHPSWCDQSLCHTTPKDAAHVSRGTSWVTRDTEFELGLRRTDEGMFPGQSETEAALWLTGKVMEPTADGSLLAYLDATELKQMAGHLLVAAALLEAGEQQR